MSILPVARIVVHKSTMDPPVPTRLPEPFFMDPSVYSKLCASTIVMPTVRILMMTSIWNEMGSASTKSFSS